MFNFIIGDIFDKSPEVKTSTSMANRTQSIKFQINQGDHFGAEISVTETGGEMVEEMIITDR